MDNAHNTWWTHKPDRDGARRALYAADQRRRRSDNRLPPERTAQMEERAEGGLRAQQSRIRLGTTPIVPGDARCHLDANRFVLMDETETKEMAADIKANGQKIRLNCCQTAGLFAAATASTPA